MISGFINIDKPAGITSHDVIFRLRRWTKIKKIGHTGTLDPDATGVLPIAIGPACRLIDYLTKDKVYFAEILLGLRTNTDDLSGRVLEYRSLDPYLATKQIEEVFKQFTGAIKQIPPLYSAVHHNGQRLHHLARRENNLVADADAIAKILSPVKERDVNIRAIDILGLEAPILKVRISCSSGTYIRSLARDLGDKLGCGACLKSLRREQSGSFHIEQSLALSNIEQLVKSGKLASQLINPANVLNFRTIKLDAQETILLTSGQFLDLNEHNEKIYYANEKLLVTCDQETNVDNPFALARVVENCLRPEVVLFAPDGLQSKNTP